ncbi:MULTISPECIES: sulfatase-like hydrolase/transferase [Haloferax]|uniref:AlkP-core domain protein n=2 Tax=Haloferax gibbonsii TaxID=35746 RepID=A0A0K1ISQ3_HALGI|nr:MULTISPECIES: sulfatase-like hydrolase/transferase [Haloferax]AKU07577.1 sulfatase [Haloferax gibbonsii]ELZ77828.1 sulfatase [Haloferax gibbonsii ATCC 33959]QOS11685.1 AlkP-core domain protein [Haloferax gibbonsii]RDZ55448.1 sulfatase [Haloferax sp. Atlit-4N]REA04902.1 sulfatase [Haloferax sp. Atlit-6N]
MRNVVLICLDTVRKDYFDRFAERLRERADASFDQCRAASGWSVPSHASMMTGKLPHQHGIHVYNRDFSGLRREDTFLADLPDHRAFGSSANVYASDAFGFDLLFDDFTSVSPDRRFPDGIDAEKFGQECEETGLARYLAFLKASLASDHPVQSLANGALVEFDRQFAELPVPKPLDDGANIVSREAVKLVREHGDADPFFMFTNFMDAHGPLTHVRGYDSDLHDAPYSWTTGEYSTHEVNVSGELEENWEHIEHTRGLYGAAIDYLDRKVCSFIDRVQDETDRETTFVITADHGENLAFEADGGLLAHKGVLTEGLLHVPLLVVNAPEGYDDSETGYFSHVDLGRLLVGLARGETPDVFEARIAAERIGSNMAADASEAERREWDRMIRVVYDGADKYEWDSNGTRLRHRLDPDRPNWQELAAEDVDIGDLDEAFFDAPLDEYKREAVTASTDHDVDQTTKSRLSDLGYI